MPIKVEYVVRETFTNLRRNLSMTLAAVLTVTVSLALVGGALLLSRAVQNATIRWKGGVEVSIFMKPDSTPAQQEAVEAQLRGMPEVKEVRFVSKAEAYEEFKKLFANSPDLVESVTPDSLPPSYRVVPKAAEQAELIGEPFKDQPGVYDVALARKQIKTLLKVTSVLRLILLSIAGLLLLSAAVLIINTIQLAIFARRREVAVMKLVGATNWFIRVPFMFEGLLQGLAGAAVAFGSVWVGARLLLNAAANNDFWGQFYVSSGGILSTGMFMLIVGAGVGALGSALAVSRFLDV
jgi:cell division transport system permease protein